METLYRDCYGGSLWRLHDKFIMAYVSVVNLARDCSQKFHNNFTYFMQRYIKETTWKRFRNIHGDIKMIKHEFHRTFYGGLWGCRWTLSLHVIGLLYSEYNDQNT